MTRNGLISAAESAYDLSVDATQWLDQLCVRVADVFRPSLGVVGYFHQANAARDGIDIFDGVTRHAPAGADDLLLTLSRTATPEIVRDVFMYGPVSGCIADALAPHRQDLGRSMFQHHVGANDAFCIMVRSPVGASACIALLQREVMPRSNPALLERYHQLAAHVAAGLRLRNEVGSIDATLDTDGRCLDARGDARGADLRAELRRAVRARDAARTARADEERALEIWQGLVSGRWSLVDSYESDGRRFVVARKNAPAHRDPRRLTLRERQVAALLATASSNKLIAYHLGLAVSTVGELVTSIRRKLGASSRAELIFTLRSLDAANTRATTPASDQVSDG